MTRGARLHLRVRDLPMLGLPFGRVRHLYPMTGLAVQVDVVAVPARLVGPRRLHIGAVSRAVTRRVRHLDAVTVVAHLPLGQGHASVADPGVATRTHDALLQV